MATFSCWTIGPAKISKCGHLFEKNEKIGISPVHSWLNFILTTGIAIFSYYNIHSYLFFFFPIMALAILVTMIFLLHGDYILCCKCCKCCSCCTISNCNNNVQYTFLNTANMEEEFPVQETTNQPSPSPSPSPTNMSCICSCNCCRNCLSYFFVALLIVSLFIFPISIYLAVIFL